MIQRSVPGYSNIISMIGMLAERFVQPGTQVYDWAARSARQRCRYVVTFITKAVKSLPSITPRRWLNAAVAILMLKAATPVEVVEGDIRDIEIRNASMVVLNFTLQFTVPDDRQRLLDKIYQGLNPGGALVLSEIQL